MPTHGEYTINEIMSQPAAWQSAIEGTLAHADALRHLFARYEQHPLLALGSGSPHHLAVAIAALIREYTGRACLAAPSAELIFNPQTLLPANAPALAIIFSRSGETSEAIAAAKFVQGRGGAVIAIGCDAATPLMQLADAAIEVAAGHEESAAQTRSFAGMYVAAQLMIALCMPHVAADDQAAFADELHKLPMLGPRLLERARASIGELATDPGLERIFVLGSGIRYGIACEAALKFQEMSLTNIHAYNPLEFRHGPMSMADEHALVIGLIDERNHAAELAVLSEAQALGAQVVAVAERRHPQMDELPGAFALESGLGERARTVLYLPPLQLMAYERAMAKKLNPDSPRNVTKFVRVAALEALNG